MADEFQPVAWALEQRVAGFPSITCASHEQGFCESLAAFTSGAIVVPLVRAAALESLREEVARLKLANIKCVKELEALRESAAAGGEAEFVEWVEDYADGFPHAEREDVRNALQNSWIAGYNAAVDAAPPAASAAREGRTPLTKQQIVECLVEAGCLGTVRMSYDSGPYEITRASINAGRFARAIERAHGIGVDAALGARHD